jgi:hypothetical protein
MTERTPMQHGQDMMTLIADALDELEKIPGGREASLVRTKLEEAIMWGNRMVCNLRPTAAAGRSFNPDDLPTTFPVGAADEPTVDRNARPTLTLAAQNENPPTVYYYLRGIGDEIMPYQPTLKGIVAFLADGDSAYFETPPQPGDVFKVDTITILGWCLATHDSDGWTTDMPLPSMDFLAKVDEHGDEHWVSDDILYGENLDEMMRNLTDRYSEEELGDGVWIVSGEGNKTELYLTYNGPEKLPTISSAATH